MGSIQAVGNGRLVVGAPEFSSITADPGDSIAVNGCCLTVVELDRGAATVRCDLLPDTLARTNLGALAPGDAVNLEPALRVGDAMGGHWVQGHVDAVGTVRSARDGAGSLDVWLDVPHEVLRLCVGRGSLAVDGVSLTIMDIDDSGVRISLIPETRARTTLGAATPGRPVNLEADVLARYVERLFPQ
jgi:riboflavin synthase